MTGAVNEHLPATLSVAYSSVCEVRRVLEACSPSSEPHAYSGLATEEAAHLLVRDSDGPVRDAGDCDGSWLARTTTGGGNGNDQQRKEK